MAGIPRGVRARSLQGLVQKNRALEFRPVGARWDSQARPE